MMAFDSFSKCFITKLQLTYINLNLNSHMWLAAITLKSKVLYIGKWDQLLLQSEKMSLLWFEVDKAYVSLCLHGF